MRTSNPNVTYSSLLLIDGDMLRLIERVGDLDREGVFLYLRLFAGLALWRGRGLGLRE